MKDDTLLAEKLGRQEEINRQIDEELKKHTTIGVVKRSHRRKMATDLAERTTRRLMACTRSLRELHIALVDGTASQGLCFKELAENSEWVKQSEILDDGHIQAWAIENLKREYEIRIRTYTELLADAD